MAARTTLLPRLLAQQRPALLLEQLTSLSMGAGPAATGLARSLAPGRVLSTRPSAAEASDDAIAEPSSSGMPSSSAMDDDTLRSAFGYCMRLVRQHDRSNYAWIIQMDKSLRPALLALRAFNVETALIADQVKSKEAAMVQIRFKWWKDAVSAAVSGRAPPQHPVAIALAAACSAASGGPSIAAGPIKLPGYAAGAATFNRYNFNRILDTREQDLVMAQPPLTLDDMEQYAEGTTSQLFYLQLAAAGVKSRDADHAASHLGRAVGIAMLLKGTPVHAAQRRSYLPVDLCAQHQVSQEDIYSGAASSQEGLKDVALKVASRAKGHLDEARKLQDKLPDAAKPLMLPALACGAYLQALEAANFDLFEPRLLHVPNHLSHVLSLKWNMWRGSY